MITSLTLRRWLVSGLSLLAPTTVLAQTQAPTLLDDFNRPDSPTVGAGWQETETTSGTGAAIISNQLKLSSGVLGKDYVSRDVSGRYSPVLRQNADQLTWLFNMQQSRHNPSGFAPNNYGVAFVLAGSAADFTTGNGYAVVYGNLGQPDSLRLVRDTNGLAGPANLRTLVAMSVPITAGALTGPAHTVRVLYAPDEDNWTLEVSANTATFDDPTTATFVRIGVRKDSALATTPQEAELALTVFPNPTAGGQLATLSYYLKASAMVSADVLDALGRPVRALSSVQVQGAGPHTLTVPTASLAAGLYTVRLVHDGATAYRKLVVE
jgi:hypothetical protein